MPSQVREAVQHLLSSLRRHDQVALTDGQLLGRFIEHRDDGAVAALMQRHGPMVWGVCRRMLANHHDAEDAFQATFLVLVRRATSIRPREMVGNWLYGVAHQTAIKAWSMRAKRRNREQQGTPMPQPQAPAQDAWRDLQLILDEELSRLPDKYRVAIVLCDLEGKTRKEVARQLGLPEGTLAGRLSRGRALLARRLGRHGIGLSTATLAALLAHGSATASVPAPVLVAALRTVAASVSSSGAASGAVSATVLGLADSVTRATLAQVLLKTTALIAILAMLALGYCGLASHQAGDPPPEVPTAAESRADSGQQPSATRIDVGPRDAHGDPLPVGAAARMGTARFRHYFPISDVTYSPDGKLLATAGTNDRQVRLWDAATGRLLTSVPGNKAVAFTKDGQRLYHAGSNVNAEPKLLHVARLQEEPTSVFAVNSRCVAMSPDGHAVAVDNNGPANEVRVYDVRTGKMRFDLTDHPEPVSCIVYSSDGKMIATAGDDAVIRLWNAATGNLLHRLDGHKPDKGYAGHMVTVAFSPDNARLVSAGIDKTVRLWDTASGKELRRLGMHKAGALCAAFTPDGKQVLSGGFGEPIRLWDADTGKEVRRFPKRSEDAARIAFAPGGKTFAAVHWGNHAPRFWDLAAGDEVPSPTAPESELSGVVFSPDSRVVTTIGYDRLIRQWSADTGRQITRWDAVLPPLANCLECSADGRTMAAGDAKGTIVLWEASTGKHLRSLKGPRGWVTDLAFAPGGKTLASGAEGAVILWEVATGAELRRFKGLGSVAFTPDGKTLASIGSDASGGSDHTVCLWRADTGAELRRLKMRYAAAHAVAISPDGRMLLVASLGESPIQSWELATGRELPPVALPGHEGRIFSLGFSPDGHAFATGGEDGVVRLWETLSGKERRRFVGHTGWVTRVRFAPDGKRLASASNDTTMVVWDLVTPSADDRKRAAALTDEDAKTLWAELAGDAKAADRAIRVFAAAPAVAVPLLKRSLTPVAKVNQEQVKRLIAQLDSEQFAVRERAATELATLGDGALPTLRATLSRTASLEQRRRVEHLVERAMQVNGSLLQSVRAMEVLERIGTRDAQALLAVLAGGAPEARLTLAAKAAMEHLARIGAAK